MTNWSEEKLLAKCPQLSVSTPGLSGELHSFSPLKGICTLQATFKTLQPCLWSLSSSPLQRQGACCSNQNFTGCVCFSYRADRNFLYNHRFYHLLLFFSSQRKPNLFPCNFFKVSHRSQLLPRHSQERRIYISCVFLGTLSCHTIHLHD